MSFLNATGLATPLRTPYHQGNVSATVLYSLLDSVTIGEHRVLLKKNFDTACWVPPAGKKAAHSIYLGDLMLQRVVERFVKQLGNPALQSMLKLPKFEQQVDLIWDRLDAEQQSRFLAVMKKAVLAYGRHERSHALDTPRDLKKVTKDLAAIKVKFELFNLFEDARIEERDRRRTGDRFGWVEIEALAPMTSPLNLFFRCIQLENRPDKKALKGTEPLPSLAGTKWEGKPLSAVAARVAELYQATIGSATAEGLYPIMVAFINEFKPDADNSANKGDSGDSGEGSGDPSDGGDASSGASQDPSQAAKGEESQAKPEGGSASEESDKDAAKGEGSGDDDDGDEDADPYGQPDDGDGEAVEERGADLTTAAQAADEGDKFFAEFDANATVVDGEGAEADEAKAKAKAKTAAKNGTGKDMPGQGIPDSIGPVASGGRAKPEDFLADIPGAIDATFKARVQALTQTLLRMFKAHTLNAATDNPGHRISGRHLARGELRFVHKKVFGGKGKRKYSIVFDCSGSMNGYPAREGKVLLLALNELARRGYLEGSLILSGFPGGRPGWLKYAFPVAEDLILRIVTKHGSEGLQAAIEDNLADIKKCDDLFVYTDSNICDAPINRARFAQHRVFPVGLYAGSEENTKEMQRHFPQNIIRDNIEAIVETMVTRNRR